MSELIRRLKDEKFKIRCSRKVRQIRDDSEARFKKLIRLWKTRCGLKYA